MTAFQKYAQLPIDAYSSQATGQFLLDGCRRDGCGIQPAGLWVATFGPSKVAKIKADAGVTPIAGMGLQVTPTIPVLIEDKFQFVATHDIPWRLVA